MLLPCVLRTGSSLCILAPGDAMLAAADSQRTSTQQHLRLLSTHLSKGDKSNVLASDSVIVRACDYMNSLIDSTTAAL